MKRPMMHAALMALVALMGLAACDGDPVEAGGPTLTDEGRTRILPTLPDGHVPLGPVEGGQDGAQEAGRSARRLSVATLRTSIPRLFGGVRWTIEMTGRTGEPQVYDLFDALARTLGEPDYLEVTQENTDPSPLFANIMDDMAGDVCRKAVDQDGAGGPDANVIRYPDDPDANLIFLRLKLHSIHVSPGESEGIADLRTLYDDLREDTGASSEAWYGVCVAMVTAPEFMGY